MDFSENFFKIHNESNGEIKSPKIWRSVSGENQMCMAIEIFMDFHIFFTLMVMVHSPHLFMHVHLFSFMRGSLMTFIKSSLINRFISNIFAFSKSDERF